MDKLYIGDIPSEYCYAVWGSDYVTLYNTDTFTSGTYTYYRIYLNVDGFYYSTGSTTVSSNYTSINATQIEVTDNFMYRRDIDGIMTCVFIFVVFFVVLLNIVTSCVRKGGILSGLL